MSNIPSLLQKIQIEGARVGSATSEALIQYMGASVNKIIDMLSSPTNHNVIGEPTVVHLQTGYGIYPDSTSYTIPAGYYAFVVSNPRNNGEVAGITGVTLPKSFGSTSVTDAYVAHRLWAIAGDTIHFASNSGQGGDHYIYLFPTVAIHDYPTS